MGEHQVLRFGADMRGTSGEQIYAPLQNAAVPTGTRVERDIAYGDTAKSKLDLFAPLMGKGGRSIIIFVHGGAFRFDGKSHARDGSLSSFYDNVMTWAVRNGWVGININYDLASEAAYPHVRRQIAMAVAWARAHAKEIGGSGERIVLWGHSAGASHVASYLAHPETYTDIAGAVAPVRGAVLYSGIYDMAHDTSDHVCFGLLAQLGERSSVAGLVASHVPLLVETAQFDPPNMGEQAKELDAALTGARIAIIAF